MTRCIVAGELYQLKRPTSWSWSRKDDDDVLARSAAFTFIHSFFIFEEQKYRSTITMATVVSSNMSTDSNSSAPEGGEVDTVYNELLNFLKATRADLRKAAADATLATLVSSSSSSDDGAEETSMNNEAAQRLTSLNAVQPLCRRAFPLLPHFLSCLHMISLEINALKISSMPRV